MKEFNRKKPLYRKVNTKARGVQHNMGGDFCAHRNSKKDTFEHVTGSMHGKTKRGLDYTPLFKFLISKVGMNWATIYAEAKSRIDHVDPIFWMVKEGKHEEFACVRLGESSYYSGLYVDDEGLLQKINPLLSAEEMEPYCSCCTHTFNGVVFGQK